jgi:hypothetical protein
MGFGQKGTKSCRKRTHRTQRRRVQSVQLSSSSVEAMEDRVFSRAATSNLRACLKIRRGAVFGAKAGWQGATKENTPCGSSTEEQRSRPAFAPKTLRAAGLLSLGFVVARVKARCGDSPPAPPRPKPKSLAAAPLPILRQALKPGTLNPRSAASFVS